MRKRSVFAVLAFLVGSCSSATAGFIYPVGLNPGDHYRIAFVTSGVTLATITDIAHYDTFVTDAATAVGSELALLGATWQVIGSTATVDAYSHIGGSFSFPIYRPDGVLVASGSAGLWSGALQSAIDIDEYGSLLDTIVWTGTHHEGLQYKSNVLGSSVLVEAGLSTGLNVSWVDGSVMEPGYSHSLYGISSDLIVPYATPEPGTVGMMLLGAVCAVGVTKKELVSPGRYRRA